MKSSILIPSILRITLLMLFLSAASTLLAETGAEDPANIAARVQNKYDQMVSLSFSFKQQSKGQMSGRPRMGGGTAVFYKKDKTSRMRWDYNTPDQQVLISDGETFSMYFADLQQMIVTPAHTLDNDLTYSFFSGQGKITEKFHVLPPDEGYSQSSGDNDQPKAFKLVPKETQSQIESIHLWVTDASLIRRIEILDHFDTVTVLNLNDIKVNPLAADGIDITKLFSFTPPEGTEIIHQ